MTTGGKFNILTSTGRCSIISNEIAFNNLGDSYNREEQTSAHGETASFEYIAAQDPEWIFCLDRDIPINTSGATPAEGGIQALDYMLKDLESVML